MKDHTFRLAVVVALVGVVGALFAFVQSLAEQGVITTEISEDMTTALTFMGIWVVMMVVWVAFSFAIDLVGPPSVSWRAAVPLAVAAWALAFVLISPAEGWWPLAAKPEYVHIAGVASIIPALEVLVLAEVPWLEQRLQPLSEVMG